MPASSSPTPPNRLLRALAGGLILVLSLGSASAGGGAYEDLPAAVIAALDGVAPGLVFTEIEIDEEDEGTLYEIHGTAGGEELEAKLNEDGEFLELKFGDDDAATIPADITASLGELFPGIAATKCEERSAGGLNFFEIAATVGTRQVEIRIESGGRLLEVETSGLTPDPGPDSGSPIELAELPAPVAAQVAAYEIHRLVASGAPATHFFVWGSLGNALVTASFGAGGELLSYALDRDADLIGDLAELELGSDLERWDSDGDDYPDGFEIGERCNPLDASSHPQIISVSADPGTKVIHIGVATFYGADFTLEQCGDTAGAWEALGANFTGDDTVQEFVLPIAEQIGRCFFRVVIRPRPEESSKRDADSTPIEGHCNLPESINGLEIRIGNDDDGGGSRSLHFKTPTRGEIVELEGDEVELSPFAYVYERIGECKARVTLTFSTSDGFETEVFTLTFTSDSQGAYVCQEFEHGEPEDPERGDFTVSAN